MRESGGKVGPVISDNGNIIADVLIDPSQHDYCALHSKLKDICGVVETGLFISLNVTIYVGFESGSIEELHWNQSQ